MNIKNVFILLLKKEQLIKNKTLYLFLVIFILIDIKTADQSLSRKFEADTEKILRAVQRFNEVIDEDGASTENARKEVIIAGRASQNTLDRMFLKTTLEGEKNSNHSESRPNIAIVNK